MWNKIKYFEQRNNDETELFFKLLWEKRLKDIHDRLILNFSHYVRQNIPEL